MHMTNTFYYIKHITETGNETSIVNTLQLVYVAHAHVCKYFLTMIISLVPRPHPLTRRNGLVNQVEFLGLAGALATV